MATSPACGRPDGPNGTAGSAFTRATPKAQVVVPPHDLAPRIFFATAACQSGKPLQRAVRSGQPAETGPAGPVPGP